MVHTYGRNVYDCIVRRYQPVNMSSRAFTEASLTDQLGTVNKIYIRIK
jgi:hypothetical protein